MKFFEPDKQNLTVYSWLYARYSCCSFSQLRLDTPQVSSRCSILDLKQLVINCLLISGLWPEIRRSLASLCVSVWYYVDGVCGQSTWASPEDGVLDVLEILQKINVQNLKGNPDVSWLPGVGLEGRRLSVTGTSLKDDLRSNWLASGRRDTECG